MDGKTISTLLTTVLPVLTLVLGLLLSELFSRARADREAEREAARAQRDANREHDRWVLVQRRDAYLAFLRAVQAQVTHIQAHRDALTYDRPERERIIADVAVAAGVVTLVGPTAMADRAQEVLNAVAASVEGDVGADDAYANSTTSFNDAAQETLRISER